MVADPVSAPARPDLDFLRRRTRRGSVALAPGSGSVSAPVSNPVVSSGGTRSAGVDYVHHDGGGSLDLSSPPAAPAPLADPLNLGDLLDLSERDATTAPPRSDSRPSPAPAVVPARVEPAFEVPRVKIGTPKVLSPLAPTVTLTRLQSGVGTLTIEAASSSAVGDLRLGCAWELRSGLSSVVQPGTGVVAAPPGSKRPVIVGDRSNFERLRIDLRQARELDRLVVYAFSESGGTLNWGGTLVVSTFGGARVELPLDRPPAASVQVLMSLYNVDGEFVLRAEMEQFNGPSIRQAVDAYDFHRVTWIDTRNPLT